MDMIVKRIDLEDTYALRMKVLRPGGELSQRRFEKDGTADEFHLGVFAGEALICIGSFYPEKHPAFSGPSQYRLRGMATDPDHQGRGAGSLLLEKAFNELRSRSVDLLWCNARVKARVFYKRMGFSTEGDEFDVPGIGLHYLMYRPM